MFKSTSDGFKNAKCLALSVMAMCSYQPALAGVQVLMIRDASPSGSNISAAAGLCVVNAEAGKGVHLSFSSSQGVGSEGTSWQMRDGFTGAVILHRQGASLSDGTGEASICGAPGGALFNIPTGRVASSASVCPPGGNVRMASNLFPALHLRVSGQRL
jgi:hypothetical protein